MEVSWSHPSHNESNSITGYRIYYGNQQNFLVPSFVTSIALNFSELSQVGSVSIRSESTQLPSELITATVVMVIAGPGKSTQPKVITLA